MGWKKSDLPDRIRKQVEAKEHNRESDAKAFEGDVQRIFINKLPPMLNGSNGLQQMHWAKYQKVKKKWSTYIWLEKPRKHLGKVNIRFTRISTATPDPDNVAASAKVVFDGLVDNGVIEDDSFDVIQDFDVRWKKADSMREQGVLIEIEDV